MQDGGTLREVVERLSGELEDGRVAFDDEGRVTLAISDDVLISIDHLPETDQILLFAELGELADGPASGPLIGALLHEGLELAATSGGTFGYDPETRQVAIFARRNAADLAGAALGDWIGEVGEIGDVWSRRLREARPSGEAG